MAINNTQPAPGTSYVEWGAVIAGAVIASAVSIIFINFGNAIGLSIPATYDNDKAQLLIVTIGLWLFWVQLLASMSGGYLAGRMRAPFAEATEHESEIRDGLHGLLVWALSTIVAAIAITIAGTLAALAADEANTVQQSTETINNIAHNAGIIFGFVTAASALVSAVAAYWIATVGGDHRDNKLDLSSQISFRKTKNTKKK